MFSASLHPVCLCSWLHTSDALTLSPILPLLALNQPCHHVSWLSASLWQGDPSFTSDGSFTVSTGRPVWHSTETHLRCRAMASSKPLALATSALATLLDAQPGCLTSVAHGTRHLPGLITVRSWRGKPRRRWALLWVWPLQTGGHWRKNTTGLWGISVVVPWLCPPVLRDLWRGYRLKSPGFLSTE